MKKGDSSLKSADFDLNKGKVIDTLQTDYLTLFSKPLDWEIYEKDVELWDPSGKLFEGLGMYKGFFSVLRFLGNNVFRSNKLKYKIDFDPIEAKVKVRFELTLYGYNKPLVLDGISNYYLNWEGWVYMHEITDLQVISPFNKVLQPPYLQYIFGPILEGGPIPTPQPAPG